MGQNYLNQIADPFLKIYASLLIFIGIPGNIISGVIMGGNKSNRLTTRILMIILSIADTAVLLTAVARYWIMRVLGWDLRNIGLITCRIHTFSVAFTTDFAVGALCAIAVERLLVVAFPHRANSLVTLTSVSLGMTSFGVTVVIKNLLHFWMMGPFQATKPGWNHSTSENFTEVNLPQISGGGFRCKPSKDYDHLFKLFTKLDLISFAVLPYVILFTSNVYIYVKLRKQQAILRKSRPHATSNANVGLSAKNVIGLKPAKHPKEALELQNSKKSTQIHDVRPNKRTKRRPDGVIKLLTALTLIHVGCTLPGTLFTFVTVYFKTYFNSLNNETGLLIKSGLVMLVFTNNAINFFGYYASCTSFRDSFRNMFSCLTTSSTGRYSLCLTVPNRTDRSLHGQPCTADNVQVVVSKPVHRFSEMDCPHTNEV
ncbi:Kappa-type opioid receptor [Paragonimus heterotremus]|uniref:Kappa-type opioid receptor n=1 Tax=Paragonimus heterotremus TaxID=100268 RepID=A0A8J4WJM7_9TREM|nr:Kappa-type opioid receptor [Paragonimus heterotremus]